jgi:hypothetical protein
VRHLLSASPSVRSTLECIVSSKMRKVPGRLVRLTSQLPNRVICDLGESKPALCCTGLHITSMFPSSPTSPILSYFPKKMMLFRTTRAVGTLDPNLAPKPDFRMANPPPLLMLPGHITDHPKFQKDASKFDVISAYKSFVNDPDVSIPSSSGQETERPVGCRSQCL